jgi:AcrR family transcriptional regulator
MEQTAESGAGGAVGLSRRARKEATRQALKACAYRSLAERGWAATQVADLCAAAGLAAGTFYVHFPDKEAVLAELLADFNEELADRVARMWSGRPPRNPRRLVGRVARAFLDHWTRHRGFVRACAEKAALGTSLEALRDGVNPPMVALVSRALSEAAAALGARLRDPDLVTQALLAMWLRVGMQALFNPDVTRARAEAALVRLTLGALQGVIPALARRR